MGDRRQARGGAQNARGYAQPRAGPASGAYFAYCGQCGLRIEF
jgi:hypothetical protein